MTKTRFNTYDVVCSVTELQRLVGMRVNQIYDIDNKTYLIRLVRNEEKIVLLLESGNRFHMTAFEWPKNVAPSGFTMKLRKHLKNKRLESMRQLGVDRIVDFQFGTGEAGYHIILELYDRGNILLTDCDLKILNILRPHVEGEELRFAVRERYPTDRAKADSGPPPMEKVREAIAKAHPGDSMRTVLNPILEYGASVIDHVLHKHNLFGCRIGGEAASDTAGEQVSKKNKRKQKAAAKEFSKVFNMEEDMTALMCAINDAETMLRTAMQQPSKGFIIQKRELKPAKEGEPEEYYFTNLEYHPYLYNQYKDDPIKEFDSFTASVDEFYSTLEGQKIDLKAFAQEREALKKLSNVKTDHAKRLEELSKVQLEDRKRAELITRNQNLVDSALLAVQSALAAQMSWTDIQDLVKAAQANNDPVAACIKQLKLEINHISLLLKDPYAILDEEDEDEDSREDDEEKLQPMVVDVDLALTAFANARRYYDQRRFAARKEQKTIESSSKALKNAEKKTIQTLKDVRTQTTITKARKVYWFEKFYWFISSENYLVIGGRDQQQNELIVKRYMRATDIYVHAEIQGASSVVIKNPSGEEIPPKTLLEAGTMAISYSVAWDAKVVTSAYWVRSDQVSKTAPTGEYLTTGSFMIRGKKNFLPPCHLVLGLSFMFKLEESSVERHKGERRVRNFDDESVISKDDRSEISETVDEEVQLEEGDSDSEETAGKQVVDKTEECDEIHEKVESLSVADIKEEDPSDGEHKSESESDDTDTPKFPDTHVMVEHDTGKVSVQSDPVLQRLTSQPDPESVIFLGDNKPYIITPAPPRKKQVQKSKQKAKEKEKAREEAAAARSQQKDESQKTGQLKRGQRNKMRKIKEKYKDQDEEERKLMMDILKSAGSNKNNKKEEPSADDQKKFPGKKPAPKPKVGEVDELGDDTPAAADVDMLDSLTGQPMEEDELLFAVPVIAPYQSLQNYKFKVKLTPGTGKRGKASKTALQIFLKDKQCSNREKDLLKAVKDEVLARNIPGKVKLSAPQLQKVRK
ncbi:ribosome quality control complex subunit NEMF homolog [Sabethes cyaneus]|uniref:ribosome quality control complex subunit NEMF homolog n=1 Tax=Sabethes cyaneus TaxID=53552 RepID=UPI00237EB268|nr:ribosome quality control complex subunit NEMF homolog [Sabethes cyaneus]